MKRSDAPKDMSSSQHAKVSSHVRSRVTLAQMELMRQVANMRNITAAGRELGISGSLAARQIAALERALGMRLFQRTTRSIRPTEAGERVLEWISQTLDGFTELDDSMNALAQMPRGVIRLAVNYYTAEAYLPRALTEFYALYPDIKVSVVTTDELVDLVAYGIDVAIHSGRIPDSSMVGIKIRSVHRVLCASPEYLQGAGIPRTLDDLRAHSCLVHSTNEPVNWFFRRGDETVGIAVRPRFEANNHNVLLEFARHGLGIARLGRNTVREDIKAGRLIQLLPAYACVYPSGELPNVWILYPNRRLLYRTRVLVDFLTKKLSALTEYPSNK